MTVLGKLVSRLDHDDPDMQQEAIVRLVKLFSEHAKRWDTAEFPGALAGLVRLLFKDESPTSQEYAAWALGNLSGAHTPESNKQKMADFPQVLSGLVRLLSRGVNPAAQEEAARAMRNLACAQENNQTMSRFPGAFPALLNLLFEDGNPSVQIQATMAVLNLIGNAMATREGIRNSKPRSHGGSGNVEQQLPDALEYLVSILFSRAGRGVQARATASIICLVEHTLVDLSCAKGKASCSNSNVQKIADFPDALRRLLRSLLEGT